MAAFDISRWRSVHAKRRGGPAGARPRASGAHPRTAFRRPQRRATLAAWLSDLSQLELECATTTPGSCAQAFPPRIDETSSKTRRPGTGRGWRVTLASSHTLSPRCAYVLMASVIGLALFASSIPSVLYDTYRRLWSLSPLVLTLVYAVYAFGVLGTLLLAG